MLRLGRAISCPALEEAATLVAVANFSAAVERDRMHLMQLEPPLFLSLVSNSNLAVRVCGGAYCVAPGKRRGGGGGGNAGARLGAASTARQHAVAASLPMTARLGAQRGLRSPPNSRLPARAGLCRAVQFALPQAGSEVEVWQAVADWVEWDEPQRLELLPDLLRAGVRLARLDTLQLAQLQRHPLLGESGPAATLVGSAYSARMLSNVHHSRTHGAQQQQRAARSGAPCGPAGPGPSGSEVGAAAPLKRPHAAMAQPQAALQQLIGGLRARAAAGKAQRQQTSAEGQPPSHTPPDSMATSSQAEHERPGPGRREGDGAAADTAATPAAQAADASCGGKGAAPPAPAYRADASAAACAQARLAPGVMGGLPAAGLWTGSAPRNPPGAAPAPVLAQAAKPDAMPPVIKLSVLPLAHTDLLGVLPVSLFVQQAPRSSTWQHQQQHVPCAGSGGAAAAAAASSTAAPSARALPAATVAPPLRLDLPAPSEAPAQVALGQAAVAGTPAPAAGPAPAVTAPTPTSPAKVNPAQLLQLVTALQRAGQRGQQQPAEIQQQLVQLHQLVGKYIAQAGQQSSPLLFSLQALLARQTGQASPAGQRNGHGQVAAGAPQQQQQLASAASSFSEMAVCLQLDGAQPGPSHSLDAGPAPSAPCVAAAAGTVAAPYLPNGTRALMLSACNTPALGEGEGGPVDAKRVKLELQLSG